MRNSELKNKEVREEMKYELDTNRYSDLCLDCFSPDCLVRPSTGVSRTNRQESFVVFKVIHIIIIDYYCIYNSW